jgi:hypothetical protein
MNLFDRTLTTIATNKKYHFPIFLGVMVLLTLAMMYFYHPLLDGHDYYFHKMRMEALIDAIRDGNFPLYIDYNAIAGYGYLSKAFYSDFLLIPFAIIGVFTDFMTAYQTMIFTITLLCGVTTYIAVNKVYKSTYAAAVSGILYTFCIYRLIDLYHRSALGETIAFTILPIVFLGLYHIIAGDYKKRWYILTIGFCLLIYAHTISSVMTFIFVVILLLVYIKRLIKEPKRIVYLVLSGAASLPLLVYYFLPMIEQTMSDTFYFETNPITELQYAKFSFRTAVWGMTSSIITDVNQIFLPRTGILLTLAVCLRLFVREKSKLVRSADILTLLGLLSILAVTPIFPWHLFPFNKLNFIQFPWRFYEFASFFFAIAGGFYASQVFKPASYRRYFALAAIFFVCITITLGTDRKNYQLKLTERNISPEGSVDNHFNIGVGKEYLPSKVPAPIYTDKGGNTFPSLLFIAERGEKAESKRGISTVQDISKNKGITSLIVVTEGQDILELPLIYYKGYKATLDGEEIPISESEYGLLEVSVTNSGRVEAWYAGTTIQYFSWYFTLVCILIFSVYIILLNRKKKENATD